MNVKNRLRALERVTVTGNVILHMADGSTVQIGGRGDYPMTLVAAAIRGERSREMNLLAASVRCEEPSGGHLAELARAILLSPVDDVRK